MRPIWLAAVAAAGTIGVIGAGVALGTNGGGAEPGFAQKPFAGENPVELADVPGPVIHSAEVALPGAEWTEAQLDKDDILAIWEIAGTLDGGEVEVDVRPDGSVEEIEIIIEADAVPAAPAELFASAFPDFETVKIEKSIRPTESGLLETWFEWDGTTADGAVVDVDVESGGKLYVVEPD